MLILLIIVLIAMTFSFCCSLMEACLLSLSRTDIASLSETRRTSSEIWKRLKSDIQKPLAAILVVNTLANTAGAAFSGAQFNKLYGNKWLFVFSLLFSIVVILWCEILPKTLGVRYNKRIAGFTAIPFNSIVFMLRPLIRAIEFMNHPFSRKKHVGTESMVSDIRILARSAALENLLSKEQESLISRSVLMSSLSARDVMIDRSDLNVLSTAMTLTEGLIAAHLHRHTRFPLTEDGNLDKIVGYVNFKDIVGALQINPSNPSLRGVMRPVVFVKESTKVPELLAKLTRGYQHIAIVQDDKGHTRGLVTLEDIIETLVGELQDEYDTPPDFVVQLAENRFRVGGSATFRQVKTRAFPDFPRDDDMTFDAWLKSEGKGKAPADNFACAIGAFAVKIRRVVRGNVYDVIVERHAPASPAAKPVTP